MPHSAPIPADEARRLARLHQLKVLDTDAEPLFDALTRAAAAATGMPIALLTLIDADRQWFKSNVGLDGSETPRELAFCAHTIMGDDVLVVNDATRDARFADNPFVTGEPDVRFYAGAPIRLHDGLRMGALCVVDRTPRELGDRERAILVELARAVAEALDLRVLALERDDVLRRETTIERQLAEDRRRLAYVLQATQAGAWEWNLRTGAVRFNELYARLLGYDLAELERRPATTLRQIEEDDVNVSARLTHPDDWPGVTAVLRQHLRGELPLFDCEARMRHKDGRWVWVQNRGQVTHRDEHGEPLLMYGTLVGIDGRKAIEQRLHDSEAFLERTGRLAGIGGWQLDLRTDELSWSDVTCAIHDVPPGYQPTLAEALAFFDADRRGAIEDAVRKGIAEGRGWDLELPMTTSRGRRIWARVVGTAETEAGQPVRLVGAVQDITLRKRAIDALQLSERRFRRLFEESLGRSAPTTSTARCCR